MTNSRLPLVPVIFALSTTPQCSSKSESGPTTEKHDASLAGDAAVPATAVPGDAGPAAEGCEELAEQLAFLMASQRAEGWVSSSTFENSTAAMALLLCGKVPEAERIFLAFAAGGDPLPAGVTTCDPTLLADDAAWSSCACGGGFRQFRSLEPPNAPEGQFWIGDDAFLLMALEFYRSVVPVSANPAVGEHVDSLRERLKGWFLCLGEQTRQFSQEGIHAGYCDDGTLKGEGGRCFGDEGWAIELHAEGSIDVYGALRSFQNTEPAVAELRSAIKAWLDVNVWQPADSCYERGNDNIANLAADHISWGAMSLMPEEPEYACLLEAHANAVRRSFTGGVIENWTANNWMESDPNISSTLLDSNGLVISWDWGADPSVQPWFLVNRRVCLPVSNTFEYCFDFETEVEEAQSFEITFNPAGDAVSGQYDVRIPDMSSILAGQLCIAYADPTEQQWCVCG